MLGSFYGCSIEVDCLLWSCDYLKLLSRMGVLINTILEN